MLEPRLKRAGWLFALAMAALVGCATGPRHSAPTPASFGESLRVLHDVAEGTRPPEQALQDIGYDNWTQWAEGAVFSLPAFTTADGVRIAGVEVRRDGAPPAGIRFLQLQVEAEPCVGLQQAASDVGATRPAGQPERSPQTLVRAFSREFTAGGMLTLGARADAPECVSALVAVVPASGRSGVR